MAALNLRAIYLVVVAACQALEIGLVLLHIEKARDPLHRRASSLLKNAVIAILPAPLLL